MASRDSQHEQPQQHGEEDKDESFDMAALNQFDYIRFTLTDLNAVGRCVSVPRRHVDHCLHDGLGFYAGTTRPVAYLECAKGGAQGVWGTQGPPKYATVNSTTHLPPRFVIRQGLQSKYTKYTTEWTVCWEVAWLSGSALVSINVFTLRRVQLILT